MRFCTTRITQNTLVARYRRTGSNELGDTMLIDLLQVPQDAAIRKVMTAAMRAEPHKAASMLEAADSPVEFSAVIAGQEVDPIRLFSFLISQSAAAVTRCAELTNTVAELQAVNLRYEDQVNALSEQLRVSNTGREATPASRPPAQPVAAVPAGTTVAPLAETNSLPRRVLFSDIAPVMQSLVDEHVGPVVVGRDNGEQIAVIMSPRAYREFARCVVEIVSNAVSHTNDIAQAINELMNSQAQVETRAARVSSMYVDAAIQANVNASTLLRALGVPDDAT